MTYSGDVTVHYLPTASSRDLFLAEGGAALSTRPALVPLAGDELVVGDAVFVVLRRRIDPGPPCVVRLTLDHPSRSQVLRR